MPDVSQVSVGNVNTQASVNQINVDVQVANGTDQFANVEYEVTLDLGANGTVDETLSRSASVGSRSNITDSFTFNLDLPQDTQFEVCAEATGVS